MFQITSGSVSCCHNIILHVITRPSVTSILTYVIHVPDNKSERELLTQSLLHTRVILSYVDLQVDAHEKEQKLFEIYNKIDARHSTMFKGKKFKVRRLV